MATVYWVLAGMVIYLIAFGVPLGLCVWNAPIVENEEDL